MSNKKFIEKVKRLQEENPGKVVLVRNGIFLCGIGKDAVIMNNILKYKPICFQKEICKIGIPVSYYRKTIPKLQETGYSFVIYDYNSETKKEFEVYRIEQQEIYEEKTNIGCEKCWYYENRKKETNEYMQELKEWRKINKHE